MNSHANRRNKQYVNARVQGRFLGRIAAYWVLYHIVLWHGLFVYRYAQVRMSAVEGQVKGSVGSVYWQFCVDYSPLLVCSLLIMPLFMVDFLRMTHRFVGPLIRMRQSLLELMSNRRVETVEFRKGDLLPELQQTFNDFLSFYNHQRDTAASSATMPEANVAQMSEADAASLASVLPVQCPDEAVEVTV